VFPIFGPELRPNHEDAVPGLTIHHGALVQKMAKENND